MDETERDTITENYKSLVEHIRVYNVVDYLVQEKVLTVADCERCTSRIHETDRDAARSLMNFILSSSHPQIFTKFVESLEHPYPHLAESLKNEHSEKLNNLSGLRRRNKPLVRQQCMFRESALVINDSNDLSLTSLSLPSLPNNIDTRDNNNSVESLDEKSTQTKEEEQKHTFNEHKSHQESKSLSKEEDAEKPNAVSHSHTNGTDNEGRQVKRRLGSSRRRQIKSSGTSKEAGVENLQLLSFQELPEGFDELDGSDSPLSPSVEPSGIHFVFVDRRSNDLAVGLHLREHPDGSFIINKIPSDSLASEHTDLREGDILVYVNGKVIEGNSLDQVEDLMDDSFSSPQLILGIRRHGKLYQNTFDVTLERASVTLSYGLRYILGRSRPRRPGDDSVYVTRIERGSVAEMEGVKVGDEIIAINEHSLENIQFSGEIEKLFQQSCTVILQLKRREYSDNKQSTHL